MKEVSNAMDEICFFADCIKGSKYMTKADRILQTCIFIRKAIENHYYDDFAEFVSCVRLFELRYIKNKSIVEIIRQENISEAGYHRKINKLIKTISAADIQHRLEMIRATKECAFLYTEEMEQKILDYTLEDFGIKNK